MTAPSLEMTLCWPCSLGGSGSSPPIGPVGIQPYQVEQMGFGYAWRMQTLVGLVSLSPNLTQTRKCRLQLGPHLAFYV
ncbi:hypothetical protein Hanom_Chr14g01334431 [Helianthus anomalus]